MRLPIAAIVLPCLVLITSIPSAGERCELGVEPAATLLLPYFEVDIDDPEGPTTLLSINNAHPESAILNITFWTDWGVPTVNFPIFLTGYDVATMNMGLVFREGRIPVTATQATDPNDTISPHGNNPEWDGDVSECLNFLPLAFSGEPAIPAFFLERIRLAHSGQPDNFGTGTCSGKDHGDGLMRGYVTIDNTNRCGLLFPSEEGYFGDRGTGLANNVNQLFGDFYFVNPSESYAQGDSMVHIQAFDGVGDDGAFDDGDMTFYARYVGNSAIDNREALPSVFGARYLSDFGGGGGTDLVIWRDTVSANAEPVTCGTQPEWWPLTQASILDFDEEENVLEMCRSIFGLVSGPPEKLTPPPPPGSFSCMPIASQRLAIAGENDTGGNDIAVHDAGWLRLDLNPRGEGISQAWVLSLLSNAGTFSVGLPAVALHSSCDGRPLSD